MSNRKIVVEVFIKAPIHLVWERTQNPQKHLEWDIRFTTIRFINKDTNSRGFQNLEYKTRLGPFEVAGIGRYLAVRDQSFSSFEFSSSSGLSLIRQGTGRWRYQEVGGGTRFLTVYDYQTRYGCVGYIVDRILFRPFMRLATEWGFETLRLWCEGDNTAPIRRSNRIACLWFFFTRSLGQRPRSRAAVSWIHHEIPERVSELAGSSQLNHSFVQTLCSNDVGLPRGVIDSLESYRSEIFNPVLVHPEIKRFYEQTLDYDLTVTANWHGFFRWLSPVYCWLSSRLNQLGLPRHGCSHKTLSQLVAIDQQLDGRLAPRAWVRSYQDSGRIMFAAIYAQPERTPHRYMNIALPLPHCNLTGILRFENAVLAEALPGAVSLSSLRSKNSLHRTEGLYLVRRGRKIKLPLSEWFKVWVEGPEDKITKNLRALHELRVLGLKCVTLSYKIHRRELKSCS